MSGFSVTPDSLEGLANAMGDFSQEIQRLQTVQTADLTQFASPLVIEYVEDFDKSLNCYLEFLSVSMQAMEFQLRDGAQAYAQSDSNVRSSMNPVRS